MEVNEEDTKIKRVNKKRHRVELIDMDNNKHSFYHRQNGRKKCSFVPENLTNDSDDEDRICAECDEAFMS